MQVYVARDGNWGTADDGDVVFVDLGTDEGDFLNDLTDDERWQVANLMITNRDQPGYDVWSAHAALMSEQEDLNRCSNECVCTPTEQAESGTHPWVIMSGDVIIAAYQEQDDRDDDLATGEWPDDAEPAYIN